MKNLRVMSVLLVLFLLAGCVPSLHGLYDREEDCLFEPKLVGEWLSEKDGDSWAFSQKSEKVYQVIYTDKEERTGAFEGRLVKVDGALFLDLYPEAPDLLENDFYKAHLLPVHTFMLVNEVDPELKMSAMKIDELKGKLASDPGLVKHEVIRESIVLTASPEELRTFLAAYKDVQGAFTEPKALHPVSWWVE